MQWQRPNKQQDGLARNKVRNRAREETTTFNTSYLCHCRYGASPYQVKKVNCLIKLSRKEVSIMGGWNSEAEHTQADYDNHANQLNPNNDEYYHSREED